MVPDSVVILASGRPWGNSAISATGTIIGAIEFKSQLQKGTHTNIAINGADRAAQLDFLTLNVLHNPGNYETSTLKVDQSLNIIIRGGSNAFSCE